MSYNPIKIEKKWQKSWKKQGLYITKDKAGKKENFMLLVEFPYPSGNLHIGHWYAFSLPDILARYLRMNGKNVMYPIGFDAFGLPAENAAIKHDINPNDWTQKNIKYMTGQLESMGATFDWSRKVNTTDPGYYKWTQWMFIKFYENNLAYKAKSIVNWCPKDKTVLANEQVANGRCDRCGTEVIQKEIEQWMFSITKYAEDLIGGLKDLDWQETAKTGQLNWIGRSEGAKIKFYLTDIKRQPDKKHFVETFTTRADTIFGVSAVVISPELAQKWIAVGWKADSKVRAYINSSLARRELERQETEAKTGVDTGINATNPANGEKVPVWIADYVLGHYGTGAVMFVPAHDERDFELAKKFGLFIKEVIRPENRVHDFGLGAFTDDGILINSGRFSGLKSEEARGKILKYLSEKKLAEKEINYRLHDWVLSRQRYWGVPIPIVYCPSCGYKPVPEKELPVKLPRLDDFKPSDSGKSPLAKAEKWLQTTCPNCGGKAERETDTMDTFVDSSWYFMRYTDPKNTKVFADKKKMSQWLPVPMYIGGAEHNTMHLLYSRFFTKALHSLGYISFSEPFIGRRNRGIILGPDSQKMSKSRGNVVDPDDLVAQFGADTVRIYLAFMGSYEQGGPWSPGAINGVHRFLNRFYNMFKNFNLQNTAYKLQSGSKSKALRDKTIEQTLHKTIKKVGEDIENLHFNTAVSEMMKLLNAFEDFISLGFKLSTVNCKLFLLLLSPFAPHLAEEIWINVLGNKKSVHLQKWPRYNPRLIKNDAIDFIIQINGKFRDIIKLPAESLEKMVLDFALRNQKIKKYTDGKEVKKVIFVPDKLINIIV